MKAGRWITADLLVLLLLILIIDGFLFCLMGLPRFEDAARQKEWEGLDLLKKYQENHDMVGWLQVDGTDINYPVMRGEKYLNRNFRGERSASGSLFVEEDWEDGDLCTLVYGHNMWMYGTMLHPLHRFKEERFFRENRTIRFYILADGGRNAEKRTYEIMCCSGTSVDQWNYASCQYICSQEELDAFAEECRARAIQQQASDSTCKEMIVLSTCSHHVRNGKGRLLVVGELTDRREQTRIDVLQPTKTD